MYVVISAKQIAMLMLRTLVYVD